MIKHIYKFDLVLKVGPNYNSNLYLRQHLIKYINPINNTYINARNTIAEFSARYTKHNIESDKDTLLQK